MVTLIMWFGQGSSHPCAMAAFCLDSLSSAVLCVLPSPQRRIAMATMTECKYWWSMMKLSLAYKELSEPSESAAYCSILKLRCFPQGSTLPELAHGHWPALLSPFLKSARIINLNVTTEVKKSISAVASYRRINASLILDRSC